MRMGCAFGGSNQAAVALLSKARAADFLSAHLPHTQILSGCSLLHLLRKFCCRGGSWTGRSSCTPAALYAIQENLQSRFIIKFDAHILIQPSRARSTKANYSTDHRSRAAWHQNISLQAQRCATAAAFCILCLECFRSQSHQGWIARRAAGAG